MYNLREKFDFELILREQTPMTDKKYPSDLTDEEWEVVEAILLKEEGRFIGRPALLRSFRTYCIISQFLADPVSFNV